MAAINEEKNQKYAQEPSRDLIYEFIVAVSYLLAAHEFKGTALYKFLIKFARQWHVPEDEVNDILTEGVKRGVEYIRNHGKPINKPEAWLRPVCLNIMKDRVDAIIKDERKSEEITTLTQPSKGPLFESELIEQLEYLEKALKILSNEDQALIRMKFWEGKTYKQIQYHYKLTSDDGPVPSVPALRKRESRALKRLRDSFLKLYEENARTLSKSDH